MPELPSFERTLGRLATRLFGAEIPWMVVGGIAVLVHGVARLTRDIDVTVLLRPEQSLWLAEVLRPEFLPLVKEVEQFVSETRVLPLRGEDGTPVDVIFAGLPFEEDAIVRARSERLGATTIRVCTPEDLIVMKILSSRTKDREDVVRIVRSRQDELDRDRLDAWIRALATDLEDPDMLRFWRNLWEE